MQCRSNKSGKCKESVMKDAEDLRLKRVLQSLRRKTRKKKVLGNLEIHDNRRSLVQLDLT